MIFDWNKEVTSHKFWFPILDNGNFRQKITKAETENETYLLRGKLGKRV